MKSSVLVAALLSVASAQAATPQFFFDDFNYADTAAMFQQGWTARNAAGHPGLPGARWAPEALTLVEGKLRLRGTTDGTGAGTTQVQVCHQRKYLAGTYAARVRFSDRPVSGADGDPVIQTFYVVSPLGVPAQRWLGQREDADLRHHLADGEA